MKNKFTLIALAAVWSLSLWGESTIIDGQTWYYKQNDDGWPNTTATITGGPNSGAIKVPQKVSSFTVTRIGIGAFRNCSGLTSVDLPNGLLYIESDAFFNCSNLSTVGVPRGLLSIGDYAFNFTAIKSFTIPIELESIGANPFWPSQLEAFVVDPDYANYEFKGGVLYDRRTKSAVLCPPATTRTSIEIASGTVTISDAAFGGCSGIVEITIPSSVTKIKSGAFNACTSLKTVHVSGGDAYRVKDMMSVSGLDVSGIVFDAPETPDGGPYVDKANGIVWTFNVENGCCTITSVPTTTNPTFQEKRENSGNAGVFSLFG